MSKAKRKTKKELVIQKRYWDQIKKRYPFLEEKTHWYTGTKLSKKEKEETPPILSAWSGDIPEGWVIRFGHELCEELRAEFIRCGCLYTAQILQAKEKYGDLRIYLGGVPENCKAEDIIDKYSSISSSVCVHCGKMDTPIINDRGWIIPCCKECYEKMNESRDSWSDGAPIYEDLAVSGDWTTPDKILMRVYDKDGEAKMQEVDITDTVNRLRNKKIVSCKKALLPDTGKGRK